MTTSPYDRKDTKLTVAIFVTVVFAVAGVAYLASQSTERPATPGTASSSAEEPSNVPRSVDVPVGSILTMEVREAAASSSGPLTADQFRAIVIEPVYVGDEIAIESGTTISGKFIDTVPADNEEGASQTRPSVEFTTLELQSGEEVPLAASFVDYLPVFDEHDASTAGTPPTNEEAVTGPPNTNQEAILRPGTVLRIALDAPVRVPLNA